MIDYQARYKEWAEKFYGLLKDAREDVCQCVNDYAQKWGVYRKEVQVHQKKRLDEIDAWLARYEARYARCRKTLFKTNESEKKKSKQIKRLERAFDKAHKRHRAATDVYYRASANCLDAEEALESYEAHTGKE